jgi:hypothetical protein
LCLMTAGSAAGVRAGSPVELWERWYAHEPGSTREVDHSAWGSFLTRYIRIGADSIHRVAYGQMTPADRRALDTILPNSPEYRSASITALSSSPTGSTFTTR